MHSLKVLPFTLDLSFRPPLLPPFYSLKVSSIAVSVFPLKSSEQMQEGYWAAYTACANETSNTYQSISVLWLAVNHSHALDPRDLEKDKRSQRIRTEYVWTDFTHLIIWREVCSLHNSTWSRSYWHESKACILFPRNHLKWCLVLCTWRFMLALFTTSPLL